jgi:cell division topological specificity factor
MSSLFERFKGRREPSSAEIAKERLKLVLVTDRSNLSPDKLQAMQGEIIGVIKRYIPIDDADVHIKLEQRDRKNYLVADIPLYRDHTYQADTGLAESPGPEAEPAEAVEPDAAAPETEQETSESDSADTDSSDADVTS